MVGVVVESNRIVNLVLVSKSSISTRETLKTIRITRQPITLSQCNLNLILILMFCDFQFIAHIVPHSFPDNEAAAVILNIIARFH